MDSPVTLDMLKELTTSLGGTPEVNAISRHETQRAVLPAPPEAPEEVSRLKEGLSFVSPEVERGDGRIFDKEQICTGYWLGVVWAIAGLGWDSGEEIAREWSRPSERYSDGGFDEAWSTYDKNYSNPIGIGSVFKLAKLRGWSDSPFSIVDVEAPGIPSDESDAPRYVLQKRSDLMALPKLSWLVKGVLPDQGTAAVYGPSGSGKTFLILDLAAAICTGQRWFGHRTKQAPVVYLGLEGGAGLQNRVKAWEKKNKKQYPDNFKYLLSDFDLTLDKDVEGLISAAEQGTVVIIDTLNRAAPTVDENSSGDMGRILRAAKQIADGLARLVILVHHTGKDKSKGLRGHSSLDAALDAEIEIDNNKLTKTRSWNTGKVKDAKDDIKNGFRLEQHCIGVDEDGDEETSCTVESEIFSGSVRAGPSGTNQKPAYEALKKLISGSTIFGEAGAPFCAECVTMNDAVIAVVQTLTTQEKHKRKNGARTLVKRLEELGYLRTGFDDAGDAWVWLSDE
jgi:hypothetical protein